MSVPESKAESKAESVTVWSFLIIGFAVGILNIAVENNQHATHRFSVWGVDI